MTKEEKRVRRPFALYASGTVPAILEPREGETYTFFDLGWGAGEGVVTVYFGEMCWLSALAMNKTVLVSLKWRPLVVAHGTKLTLSIEHLVGVDRKSKGVGVSLIGWKEEIE